VKQDLSSPIYATLARCAARIAKLLNAPTVQADPNLAGTLDDFLGARFTHFGATLETSADFKQNASDR